MIQPLVRIFLLFFLATAPVSSAFAETAALKDHASPYLSMHAKDPVNWQLWGKDVLGRAKSEKKLVYVSIGYFSCHWCHVMQKESYSDPVIGEYLNKYFIPVKVDRELRPELDRRLIRFVEEVRGQAGWPLNVFITPDGYPVTGFTYLPRDSFHQVLLQLNEQWLERKDEIRVIARQYFEQTETSETRSTLVTIADEHIGKVTDAFVGQAMTIADELQGGFGKTMKFPSYPQLNALLKIIKLNKDIDADVKNFVKLTLDSMASFHLMDHINNGFFRYSTDPDWQTPHFEKMLYDNAQLASLYIDAEAVWPDKGYAEVGLKTIDFMNQFLANKSGGFNASLSAVDEKNSEGGGYFWTRAELKTLLSDAEFIHLQKVWSLTVSLNDNFQANPLSGIGSSIEHKKINTQILKKLRRVKKPTMPVDNKRLASWNALVLTALVKAQDISNDNQLKKQADDLYSYIRNNFIKGNVTNGIAVIRFAGQGQSAETTLEDYAQLAHAIQLYASKTQHKEAQEIVGLLVKDAFERFYRHNRWVQDTDSLIPGDEGELIIQDAVLESPSSLLLETVLIMNDPYSVILHQSNKLISRLTRDVLDTPYYYGSSIILSKTYKNNNRQSVVNKQTN